MVEGLKKISTSALAKALGKSSRQMFAELEALGWLKRAQDQWQLTRKGEFEQGSYHQSERYGRYIVWPESVLEHRALVNPEDQLTTAKGLGLKLGLSASRVNQLLADLGWISPWLKGWRMTLQGEAQGGIQQEDASTAITYVSWPKQLTEHVVFKRSVEQFKQSKPEHPTGMRYSAMDGHVLRSDAEVKIDNWLYLAGIAHACHKPLPLDTLAIADFYIPQARVYIEFWGSENAPTYLTDKMHKKTLYEANHLDVIEFEEQDLKHLDEILPRELRRFGLAC
ncbi:hypothetical protein Q4488_02195 [Amphritea sp. 1_MG-2023]|uniref:hypothetical protein n=1 Tax=Amphritea sp. 1_MG-2023 TaxID=3062670 RepID=UPI0026E18898|nr:hypothetical protein [Amphritea sp. 1_MG-2023]MDO6562182.1 hypothetical protein [Amphritea sp. 1_MG-2023]